MGELLTEYETERITVRLEKLQKELKEDIEFNEKRIASVDPGCEAAGLAARRKKVEREIWFWMKTLKTSEGGPRGVGMIAWLEGDERVIEKEVKFLQEQLRRFSERLEYDRERLDYLRKLFP